MFDSQGRANLCIEPAVIDFVDEQVLRGESNRLRLPLLADRNDIVGGMFDDLPGATEPAVRRAIHRRGVIAGQLEKAALESLVPGPGTEAQVPVEHRGCIARKVFQNAPYRIIHFPRLHCRR